MEACLFTRGCKSFNYKENAVDNCELNNETKLTAKREAMVVRGNWSYFATDQTTLLVSGTLQAYVNQSHPFFRLPVYF